MTDKRFDAFIKFASKELGIGKIPEIKFVAHENDEMRSFGGCNKDSKDIIVRTIDRHPLDVMRTIAHELVHYTGVDSEDECNAVAGKIMRKWGDAHPEMFKDKPIKEEGTGVVPANAMGASSSTAGTGGVDTYDPLLNGKRKLRSILKRKTLEDLKK